MSQQDDMRSLGKWRQLIVPVFASYEVSSPCCASCEFASYPTECECKKCRGLNHGRSQFKAQSRPFNETQWYVRNEAGQSRLISHWHNEHFSWMADMTDVGVPE